MKRESKSSEVRLLLVDDNHTNIDILRRALEPEGYSISVAPSGEVALKIAPRFIPDLILLDIMMPGIDGFETCRKLKKSEKTKDIPIIFITAKNDAEDILTGFRLGGVDYITKPFFYEEVCVRVRTHIQLSLLMRQMEEKNSRLERLNDMKSAFLGIVAHDLRNPLASILGYTDRLRKKKDLISNEEKERNYNIITSTGTLMLNMVNNLLDSLVIDAGMLTLVQAKSPLLSLIKDRVEVFEVIANRKSIELKVEAESEVNAVFDYHKIAQVIDNLLSNAIKHSMHNSSIAVILEKEDDNARVTIKDSGAGIEEKDLGRIFKRFQQADILPSCEGKSTGLGLSIAKKMIDLHNGTFLVESKLGEGSSFSFTIPC